MTKANTYVVAKIAAVVAGLALVATAFAPAARAQSAEEQIQALMAQIAALQAQMGGSSSASVTFTRDLTLGSTGSDVTALQNWLISKGHAIAAGATGYFGAQTQAALAAYQASAGISPAAGYFGPITRAKVNAAGGASTGGNGGSSDNGDLEGGEASLEDLEVNDGEDDDAEEGSSAKVAEIEFDVEDGDIKIDRVDLQFEAEVGAGEDEPWEVFESVTLYNEDGDELASEDVSDEDDWLDEDEGTFRFTGLDYVVREGDSAMIVVEVEVNDGALDDAEDTWTITVADEAIRGIDGEGIQQYTDGSDSISFDVVEEGTDDDLTVRRSSDDPDATTLQVEDDGRSDWYTVFAFELEADEDSSDIEVDSIQIDFDTGSDGADDAVNVINDVELVIDGETYDDYDFNHINTDIASTVFDIDGDLTVEGGETVTVEVRVEFKDSDTFGGTGSIQASVDGANIEAEGADDVTVDGSATGDTHQLAATGVSVTKVEDSADANTIEGTNNDYAEFEITLEIEAFEQDVYISATSSAFTFQIEDDDGADIAEPAASTTATVSSDADKDGDWYVIDENSSEEVTFRVVYTPGTAAPADYRMQLLTVKFDDEKAATQSWSASPASEYETDYVFVAD